MAEKVKDDNITQAQTYPASGLRGLTDAEAARRREDGRGNNVRIDTGRTYWQILWQNFFIFINVVLFIIGVFMIVLGLWGDAVVSVGVVMLNVVVNVAQEFRAKAKLDRIALLTRPQATIIRDGEERTVDPSEVVLGDLLVVSAGDQMVVDGVVVGDGRMDVDESLLTGESDHITKREGDAVLSGSFCVTGSAVYEATRVGAESFANKLTASAKQFRITRTPLQMDVNYVVRILLLISTIFGLLYGASYAVRAVSTIQTVQSAAVIAGLVPAGLILMTATAYAMGAVRMAGRGALIQQANAVESMSNVNVLCLDKTGTLTANRIVLDEVVALNDFDAATMRDALADYGRSTRSGNRTSDALADGLDGVARRVADEIAFSSARKYSAIAFDDDARRGTFLIGAPEFVRPLLADDSGIDADVMARWADGGLRVLLVAYSPQCGALHDADERPAPPDDLRPCALVSFRDELRDEARETLAGFIEAGITLKIISGDNPHTVAALAKQAGLPGDLQVLSGAEIDDMDGETLRRAVEETTVFGRITPEQKERLVDTLKRNGHYVAMIGDGVNDVLSLKKANIGVAMESGSGATRGVADIILLNDSFAALPAAFREGQRIINGMDDIICLFLTRAFYAAIIILGAGIIAEAQLFPFIPKHASLLTLITVGFPTLALAVWARPGPPKHNLLRSIIHFVLPAALSLAIASLAIYAIYLMNYYYVPETLTLAQEQLAISTARTALTTVTIFMGLILIPFVEPPTRWWVGGTAYSGDWRPLIMAVVMLGVYGLILAVEPLRVFFELELLWWTDYLFLATVAVVWALVLRFAWRLALLERFLGINPADFMPEDDAPPEENAQPAAVDGRPS
ncbi:MAG: HAD family hydrolase [Anaerolineaceae bacterium]|nr:MAG: HAD family hydrolase [Anaerolineaceae bacterium]